ncbi:MAG TPA: acetyl-CoA carboxylase biotin carboxylase subunit, partial [Myxococcota bacterium]
ALQEFVVKGIKTSIPFHQKVVEHPVFLEGRYDTGFIDQHLAGGKGDPRPLGADAQEARRVAFMMAAIAAYKRDKERAAAARPVVVAGVDPWKSFGRRSQMRGGLR